MIETVIGSTIFCPAEVLSQHPQFRPEGLLQLMHREPSHRMAPKIDPRKDCHSGPQEPVLILYREFHSIRPLTVGIEFALAANFRNDAMKDTIRERTCLNPHFPANGDV